MNCSTLVYALLAQVSNFERLGDGIYRGRGRTELTDFWPLAVVLAVAGVAIAVVVAMRKRNDMSEHCNDPNKLFRELSLAHNLDRASQKLLWRLAEALQLAQPAEVFVRPTAFQTEIPPSLREQENELHTLYERLF